MLLEDEKLAIDETQRIAEHEAVKQDARRGVHAEIAREADQLTESDKRSAAALVVFGGQAATRSCRLGMNDPPTVRWWDS